MVPNVFICPKIGEQDQFVDHFFNFRILWKILKQKGLVSSFQFLFFKEHPKSLVLPSWRQNIHNWGQSFKLSYVHYPFDAFVWTNERCVLLRLLIPLSCGQVAMEAINRIWLDSCKFFSLLHHTLTQPQHFLFFSVSIYHLLVEPSCSKVSPQHARTNSLANQILSC